MEQYKLKESLDTKKVFLIKRSKLENVIDSNFYTPFFVELIKKLENSTTSKFIKLSKVLSKVTDGSHHSPESNFIYTNNYITVKDLNDDGEIDLINCLKISDKDFSQLVKNGCQPSINDILFSKDGTIGKTHLVKENNFVVLSSLAILTPKPDKVLPQYLEYILKSNIVIHLIKRSMGGSALKRIILKNISDLKVPIPSKEIQQQIVDIYNSAYTQKQTKEVEAKDLLASIDSYLLNELGITLPVKDSSLEARIFTAMFSDISGGRFDPKLYDRTTTDLKQAIKNIDRTKFITKRLKDILIESVAGDWGIENEGIDIEGYTKCLVIRATEFNNDYNLTLDNSRVKFRLIKDEKLSKLNIKEGDLLIEKSGGSPDQPVGRIALITNDYLDKGALAFSNFIHKITVDETVVNSNYLFSFLKTVYNIKLTESMQSQTNGIRNLIMSTYLNQNIVLPIDSNGNIDLNKQIEIADYVAEIRSKAKKLQEEANSILEKAKQEVEQIILG
ncbi:restriction endonuclease subunit S [Chryseobacterium cucumeris]|uniref:restriction endonuclease subunit S n=1 Tax=Chryseobacterium cucumeris TaxID=1813611 RepID=UPI00192D9CD2|nr:restriction endonuclease subunit S [Chryseobacterium cucumeris]QRA41378.1 restriction endonuclease subunit S [Chryseobacterium cucumeris]